MLRSFSAILLASVTLFNVVASNSSLNSDADLDKLRAGYAQLGEKIEEAFFRIDHKGWTPEVLPSEVYNELHSLYLDGRKLQSEKDDPESILKCYLKFYSAACLGHRKAAIEAGRMLLNPAFNNILPVVTTFSQLSPIALTWDLRRLGLPMTQNKSLQEILDRLGEIFDWNCFPESEDKETYCNEAIAIQCQREKISLELSGKLEKLEQTDEVKVVSTMLEEVKDYALFMQKSWADVRDGVIEFLPDIEFGYKKAEAFAKTLLNPTFLIHELALPISKMKGKAKKQTVISRYQAGLRTQYLEEYVHIRSGKIYKVVSEEIKPNGKVKKIRGPNYTEKARARLEEVRSLEIVGCLLGSNDLSITSGITCNDPASDDYRLAVAANEFENIPIEVFLCYLKLTRSTQRTTLKDCKHTLSGLSDSMFHVRNPDRFKRLRFEVLVKHHKK